MTTTLTPLPYVWEWEDKHRTRSQDPYRSEQLAQGAALADYTDEAGLSPLLRWKPIEINLPGADKASELHKGPLRTGWIVYRRAVVMDAVTAYEVPDGLEGLFNMVAGVVPNTHAVTLRTLLKRHDELVTERERAEHAASEDSDVIADLQQLNEHLKEKLAQLKQGEGYGELAVNELKEKLDAANADAAIWQGRYAALHVALDNLQATAHRTARELGQHQVDLVRDVELARRALKETDK